MLFANISSDKIQFVLEGEETLIEHIDLEKSMAHFLNAKLKTQDSNKVVIINGPGSFTNLRISTLSLNMFNFLNNHSLDFYSIDKLSLYQKLYQKKLIPAVGYIYIGQKKNRWRVNFSTMEREQVQIHDTDTADGFVDHLFERSALVDHNPQFIELGREDESLVVNYLGTKTEISLTELHIVPTKNVEANYMMEANVTLLPENSKVKTQN